jgi:hypothetical protein
MSCPPPEALLEGLMNPPCSPAPPVASQVAPSISLWLRNWCLCVPALLGSAAKAQDEVPFITTPDHVTLAMLQMAGVTAQDFVIDLGSGDGRIVITAAKRFGARGLGVEIVPELVRRSRDNAVKAGVAERAQFREQDLFATALGPASVVTMYLLPEVNLQLRPALLALRPGTRIVSHDWDLGAWAPDRSVTLDVPDKAVGRDKKSTVHLWVVPARVQGLWCANGASLEVTQRFQTFSATLRERNTHTNAAARATAHETGAAQPAPVAVFDGGVNAETMFSGREPDSANLLLQVHEAALELKRASGAAARFQGLRFQATTASRCT